MKKSAIILGAIIIIVLIILLIYFPFKSKNSEPGKYDAFAKCLADAGLKMYGTDWCTHCQNQKELFGSSFQYIDYINCDKNKETCLIEGVEGYPTWKIDEESYQGEQTFSQLSQYTNCPLEE